MPHRQQLLIQLWKYYGWNLDGVSSIWFKSASNFSSITFCC